MKLEYKVSPSSYYLKDNKEDVKSAFTNKEKTLKMASHTCVDANKGSSTKKMASSKAINVTYITCEILKWIRSDASPLDRSSYDWLMHLTPIYKLRDKK